MLNKLIVPFESFSDDLPDQVKDAMISNQGNTNLVYTEAGEAVDLSFFGDRLDNLNDQEDDDSDSKAHSYLDLLLY